MKKTLAPKINVLPIFNTYPEPIREKLLLIRQLIFNIAANREEIGEIEETLKWGEPSYITSQTKSGSTIRLGWKHIDQEKFNIYFNCKTTLVDTFKEMFGNKLKYENNRCIWFRENDRIPVKELTICLSLALTYHLNKKKK